MPDGLFEHEPEPTAENLAGLLPKIAACGADVGFFQDPDADRLAIATAEGRYIGEEATLALAVEAVLAKHPGPVVVNCSTSGMTAAIAQRFGVRCHVSKVGEANVVDEMLARGAVLGGEGNGGVIDPRVVLVRDSFIAMALVLERLAVEATTVERLAAALPRMVMKKTKIDLSPELRGVGLVAGLSRIEAAFPFPHQGNSIHRTIGTSDYHAMQLQVTRQFSNGLQFNAHYTWSKQIEMSNYNAQSNNGYGDSNANYFSNIRSH
jgi:phosphomannomutase